jgi:asparagine synthase (glutamine-hydrolysing)
MVHEYLLTRKDRMSMANQLEVRVPFADHRLVQYAYNIPRDLLFYDGREKGLLRKSLTGILPDEVLWRKKSPIQDLPPKVCKRRLFGHERLS